jgi:hypothetical protein
LANLLAFAISLIGFALALGYSSLVDELADDDDAV